jgi:hypothetical protein
MREPYSILPRTLRNIPNAENLKNYGRGKSGEREKHRPRSYQSEDTASRKNYTDKSHKEKKVMTWKFATGIILVVIAILLIYSVFFWMPGRESRKEEKEDGT